MREVVISADSPHARESMARQLEGMAAAIRGGATVLDGGLISMGPLQLSGSITLAQPDAARPLKAPPAAAADALALVREATDLIEGDLTGYAWRKACREFVERARAMLEGAQCPRA